MCFQVAKACSERKFGSASRKQIIVFLADKANRDGTGIWCSKGTIQRHTELSESTVKRVLRELVAEGMLVKTGERRCTNGITVTYMIDLAKIESLPLVTEPAAETGVTVNPVHHDPGTGVTVTGVPGSGWPPNHPEKIHKPPTRECATVADEDVEEILAAYPPDRQRRHAICLRQIKSILREGVSKDDLLKAVRNYATESAEFTRSKVCFSDNWLKGKWPKYVDDAVNGDQQPSAMSWESLEKTAKLITNKDPICREMGSGQIEQVIAAKLVTAEELRAAGVKP